MASASCRQDNRSGCNPMQPRAIKNLNPAAALIFNPELGDPDAASMDQAWSRLDALS